MNESGPVMGIISSPPDRAEALAEKLVRKRLAACAQVSSGITSFFWWDSKVQKEGEVLIYIKTLHERVADIGQFLRENHPYEVPEFTWFKITGGLPEYLRWIGEETK